MAKSDNTITPEQLANLSPEKIVSVHVAYSGIIYAVSDRGRIFERKPDPHGFNGMSFIWSETPGPKFE